VIVKAFELDTAHGGCGEGGATALSPAPEVAIRDLAMEPRAIKVVDQIVDVRDLELELGIGL